MIEPLPTVSISPGAVGLRSNWKHLRIPYQLTLAPIYLWGYFLADKAPSSRLVAGFLCLHLLLYPGITAFNSYYDRDRGPIGGLRSPPPVAGSLLRLGLALKAVALVAAPAMGLEYSLITLSFVFLSVLYSHPRFRWKARPWRSLAVVGLGQGGLGFLAGWAAAGSDPSALTGIPGSFGLLSACLTTAGMYPLTQIFQADEDLARGDRTLAVALGRGTALRIAMAALAAGGVAAALVVTVRNGPFEAGVPAAGYGVLIASCDRLAGMAHRLTNEQLFRRVMTILYASSGGFAAFILTRIAHWG